MNKRGLLKLLSVALILIIAWWFAGHNRSEFEKPGNTAGQLALRSSINTGTLIYTKHARCRMECRHIDESEVVEIIKLNKVNVKKSNPDDAPCPTISYEGTGSDGHHLRIVVADCEPRDKIVTVIDMDTDFKCDCY